MRFSELEQITAGKVIQLHRDRAITTLLTDSRKAITDEGSLFFAIGGPHHDGHNFTESLYHQGIRQFIVEKPTTPGIDANVLLVKSSITALQQIVAHHRAEIKCPVIGITGSNGKTIIKEWLYQLLSPDFKIAKNPASYNSQVGVPLSVWQLQSHHTLGIFEAGISTVNEMANLQKVIRPTFGIFSNIGSAHDEGFRDTQEKIREKLLLFSASDFVIYCKDHEQIDQAVHRSGIRGFTWGGDDSADVVIKKQRDGYTIRAEALEFTLQLPFSDQASIENSFHALMVLLFFGTSPRDIQQRFNALNAVPMRLELKEGINHCQIIDDTYNNDLAGLQVSLDFLAHQHQKKKKAVILSDIHQSGLPERELLKRISTVLSGARITHFIGIGPVLSSSRNDFPEGYTFYSSTEEFLNTFDFNQFQDEVILVKGARVFRFEKIVNQLQRKVHGTIMEIDLGALVHNLNYFKSCLNPGTRVMAMVKAFAYGSGSNEIANVLQYHKVNYLGVAYADEGVELRKNNISLPIMVMNPAEDSFDTLLKHTLEPEIFNFRTLEKLAEYVGDRHCNIHLKVDTGMHRLGFENDDVEALIAFLVERPNLHVASIFSHLAGADESVHDTFSKDQGTRFREMADRVSQRLGYRPIYHLLNSSGILRFPELQFDMVRVGIGLYGVDPTEGQRHSLKPVATLKTVISQIKHISRGESIGYGRRGQAAQPSTIATIAIGYADGFSRAFSRGVGKVLVNGKKAPVIGNVCMDMTMIDITGINAREGDEVIIFGKDLSIRELADSIQTIPYEILTSTSERVKRVFVAESI
ncbi:MAG TPA: bifunctional UDP-N-acetylmuramoyl-tripeptide:D-alanyl-D-alanine ligase/alanine racemase [Chryseosolibacter sp.]|nr:bifunctional UDP-N-acetylmuramoyl-tripeptide:D-alanyl-D-alanine ligase/alanine racemase [Chryseosolibacter sp.]